MGYNAGSIYGSGLRRSGEIPETDEGVMLETIAIMERRNIFGVLSGSPDRVAEWMSAAPTRFIPGLDFWVDVWPSPDSLREIFYNNEWPEGVLRGLYFEDPRQDLT